MIENNDSINLGALCWLVSHLWRRVCVCWWCCWWLVSFFQIESLPPELFQCRKLRTLHLGNNVLQSLPSRVGELTNLSQIELRGNRLECLPVELGECPLLKRSGLVVEEDLFNTLPLEVKERLWRADKEQAWTPGKREKPLINYKEAKGHFSPLSPRCSPFSTPITIKLAKESLTNMTLNESASCLRCRMGESWDKDQDRLIGLWAGPRENLRCCCSSGQELGWGRWCWWKKLSLNGGENHCGDCCITPNRAYMCQGLRESSVLQAKIKRQENLLNLHLWQLVLLPSDSDSVSEAPDWGGIEHRQLILSRCWH